MPMASSISLVSWVIVAPLVGAGLLWSYWPPLVEMAQRWSHDPRYSHGYLVAPFALYLLWIRRRFRPDHAGPSWPGLVLLAIAGAVRFAGAYAYMSWLEAFAFLISLAGLVALCGGRAALPWAWPSVAFLIFMVPLPYAIETALGSPLQRMATEAGACALEVCGLPAFSSGNTIVIDDFRIGVVDACNGLGMCYMFLALSVAASVMVDRPPLDRLLLIAGAIPIALVVNVARIVATGLLHVLVGGRAADAVYHDLAGWLMMLLALAILFFECRLLSHLFIPIDDDRASRANRAAKGVTGGERAPVRVQRSRAIPVLVGTVLVVGSGIIAGKWTGRWRDSGELKLAVSHLDRVPMAIGDWIGKAEAADPRVITAAELDGCVMRRYENSRSRKMITLVLVCGRPGPVSVHNPEICYPAAGFEMAQEQPEMLDVPNDSSGHRAELVRAGFERRASFAPERLRISWSWKSQGAWGVPYSPRLAFGSQPFLYKLYLIQRTSEGNEPADEAAFMDFLRRLLPELDKALGSDNDAGRSIASTH
jgi:exosortase